MPLPTPLTKSVAIAPTDEVVLEGAKLRRKPTPRLWNRASGQLGSDPASTTTRDRGAGKSGLEILQQHPDIEAIIVPIGGGGLIGGIASLLRSSPP